MTRSALARMQRTEAPLVTDELALEKSTREGIKAYVVGSVVPAGGGMVLSARLVCEIGRERRTHHVERAGNLSEGANVTSGARTIQGFLNRVLVRSLFL